MRRIFLIILFIIALGLTGFISGGEGIKHASHANSFGMVTAAQVENLRIAANYNFTENHLINQQFKNI